MKVLILLATEREINECKRQFWREQHLKVVSVRRIEFSVFACFSLKLAFDPKSFQIKLLKFFKSLRGVVMVVNKMRNPANSIFPYSEQPEKHQEFFNFINNFI